MRLYFLLSIQQTLREQQRAIPMSELLIALKEVTGGGDSWYHALEGGLQYMESNSMKNEHHKMLRDISKRCIQEK